MELREQFTDWEQLSPAAALAALEEAIVLTLEQVQENFFSADEVAEATGIEQRHVEGAVFALLQQARLLQNYEIRCPRCHRVLATQTEAPSAFAQHTCDDCGMWLTVSWDARGPDDADETHAYVRVRYFCSGETWRAARERVSDRRMGLIIDSEYEHLASELRPLRF